MSYIYVELRKTRQYGKASDQGIHLLKPTARELADAIETAIKDGYKHIYVYNSKARLDGIAGLITQEMGIQLGWGDYCQTVDAFKIDFLRANPYDAVNRKALYFGEEA